MHPTSSYKVLNIPVMVYHQNTASSTFLEKDKQSSTSQIHYKPKIISTLKTQPEECRHKS